LIVLDAEQTAPALMKYAEASGANAWRLVEPALMSWHYRPMRTVWLARLERPRSTQGSLRSAVEAARVVKLVEAVPALTRLALDPQERVGNRLEAARSLAALQTSGLEDSARRLALHNGASQFTDRLIGATLLGQHRGREAEGLLVRLAADKEPTVAAAAVRRLIEINPDILKPMAYALAKSRDAGLRNLVAQALEKMPATESVAILTPMLADPQQGVRIAAREALIKLGAAAVLREAVLDAAMHVLNGEQPHGWEQASMVVGALCHQPAGPRLLELLERRDPVGVAAAWALRRLAAPSTAAGILHKLEHETTKSETPLSGKEAAAYFAGNPYMHEQLEHLIEALGVLRYRPAAPLLKRYLPDPPDLTTRRRARFPHRAVWQHSLRGAAAWSIGYIFAGDPKAGDVHSLREVLISTKNGGEAEACLVRAMVAVSLGRMNARSTISMLRELCQNEQPILTRRGCAWALHQLTGQSVRLIETSREIVHQGWFLEPIDR